MTDAHGEKKLGFFRTYIFSTDHKVIGIQFLFTSLVFFLLGGLMAMAIRWQMAYPGTPVPILGRMLPAFRDLGGIMPPEFYSTLFTMHGTIMIFFVIIALLVGSFGNYLIPLQIGARDMAFPVLNAISYWLVPPAGLIVLAGFFLQGGAAAAGWTSYAPLSALEPIGGQNCWLIGLILFGSSSILGAINYVTTIVNLRAPGMGFFRMPLSVWGLFITAILSLFATPVVASAFGLLLLDRTVGTSFFVAGAKFPGREGLPLLWQHLFWFYSHPAVYIMILPGMGMVSEIISTHARKPIFGYRAMVYSIWAIAFLGFIVWGHHMFVSGMNPLLGTTFMLSTIVIAVPSAIKVFNWLGTLWRGSIHFTTALLNAVCFVAMFVIGGLSGIFNAVVPVDIQLHDTYWIVAHLHYVLFGGSLFAIFAGIYHWYPKMFGRMMSEKLGKLHFFLTAISYNCTFFPMHLLGIGGMVRRIYDPTVYAHLKPMQPVNVFITVSAFVLGASQVIFAINFLGSLIFGKKAGENPWRATTLEWTTPSPPPHGNFAERPRVYHGPHEYSLPGLAQDWLPQNQPLER